MESSMTYAEVYNRLKQSNTKPGKEITDNPAATLTSLLTPAFGNMYSIDIRTKTICNAVRTAIEIYIIKAKRIFSGKNDDDDSIKTLKWEYSNQADSDKKTVLSKEEKILHILKTNERILKQQQRLTNRYELLTDEREKQKKLNKIIRYLVLGFILIRICWFCFNYFPIKG